MEPQLIALTGGPGGGKTAVLEMARKRFHDKVEILPEAATIVFSGGFPRDVDDPAIRAAQRAIYHVQMQLERMALERRRAPYILCDRGTIDGLAYWPGTMDEFWSDVGDSYKHHLTRYKAVIHLRTPPENNGYNKENVVRVESARNAATIDEKILLAWHLHPRRHLVAHQKDFMAKAITALDAIHQEISASYA